MYRKPEFSKMDHIGVAPNPQDAGLYWCHRLPSAFLKYQTERSLGELQESPLQATHSLQRSAAGRRRGEARLPQNLLAPYRKARSPGAGTLPSAQHLVCQQIEELASAEAHCTQDA